MRVKQDRIQLVYMWERFILDQLGQIATQWLILTRRDKMRIIIIIVLLLLENIIESTFERIAERFTPAVATISTRSTTPATDIKRVVAIVIRVIIEEERIVCHLIHEY